MGRVLPGTQPHRRAPPCVIGLRSCIATSRPCASTNAAAARSAPSWRPTSKTPTMPPFGADVRGGGDCTRDGTRARLERACGGGGKIGRGGVDHDETGNYRAGAGHGDAAGGGDGHVHWWSIRRLPIDGWTRAGRCTHSRLAWLSSSTSCSEPSGRHGPATSAVARRAPGDRRVSLVLHVAVAGL